MKLYQTTVYVKSLTSDRTISIDVLFQMQKVKDGYKFRTDLVKSLYHEHNEIITDTDNNKHYDVIREYLKRMFEERYIKISKIKEITLKQ